jgi:predicted dithiol-disulfide oxidoreductase (DUF899 family)
MATKSSAAGDTSFVAKPSLTLERRLNAPPAKVWAAWTNAKKIAHWFGPAQTQEGSVRAELNVRVGGSFRASFTLSDLFGGRSQLIVNHFMLGPGWKEGCIGCSFGADNVEGALVHLAQRDVAYLAVSRAPLAEIEAYKKRMGWDFKWMSSFECDFNYDFHVSFRPEDTARGKVEYNYEMIETSMDELPGHSVFARDESGNIFHTYSSYGRGAEEYLVTYKLLDITPKGRDEGAGGNLMSWVKRHDEYASASGTASCCHS